MGVSLVPALQARAITAAPDLTAVIFLEAVVAAQGLSALRERHRPEAAAGMDLAQALPAPLSRERVVVVAAEAAIFLEVRVALAREVVVVVARRQAAAQARLTQAVVGAALLAVARIPAAPAVPALSSCVTPTPTPSPTLAAA